MATVAIVDDNPWNRELLETVLNAFGHRTLSAEDGAQALDVVRRDLPDLVICDILMPVMDGYEFVRAVRADALLAHLPVIFCSAHYLEQEAGKLARACGVSEILAKPCEPEEILAAVARALDTDVPIPTLPREEQFERDHRQLLTDKLSEKVLELEDTNRKLGAQYALSQLIAQVAPGADIVADLAQCVAVGLGFSAAVLWRRHPDEARLQCLGLWCGALTAHGFLAASDAVTLAPGQSAAGRAWADMQPNWLDELDLAGSDGRALEALAAGFRSGGAVPIIAGGKAVGALEVFSTEQRREAQGLIEPLQAMAVQIGQFFERNDQQQRIARLARVRAVQSGINAAIVRTHERVALFREACRIASEAGGFGIAWIGEVRPGPALRPLAWAGMADDLGAIRIDAADADMDGQSRILQAVQSGKPICSHAIAAADLPGGRGEEALQRGYRSLLALPLAVEHEVVAVMVLYAREADFFNDAELDLLRELASDLSFALEFIDKKDRLSYLALHDALTGLPNRASLVEQLTHALHAAQQQPDHLLGVMIARLDRFAYINDSFGRQIGDEVLRETARRFQESWPLAYAVAHVGPDRFAAVITDAPDLTYLLRAFDACAETVCATPVTVDERSVTLSLSAGIAMFPGDGADAESLLRNAEAALRSARGSGACAFYQPVMNAHVAKTLALEHKLRRALEREEFVLHYQPKVDTSTGNVVGLEALIRWNEPGHGLVSPVNFIPLLEQTGLIVPVGAWALRRAAADIREWRGAGLLPPRVAVNVSIMQLQNPNFVAAVGSALQAGDGQIEPLLDLEITESMLMGDAERTILQLNALRELGVHIAIDDFGTGYSSLSYLARLPVNALKIDSSFIYAMDQNPVSRTIVSTIISLAQSLGLAVIAEGVETQNQADQLRVFHCDQLQGFLVSRALPADEVVHFLRDGEVHPHGHT
ncbi:MAG: EAL domain-containing protein [Rhodocyclaceae bacterium]|nr:EAL domain-containing protein [Rhodocyclaceae bacterium]MBX3669129.1 EAL domain-containing protein [Rhodocyclaceae bacterium]